MDIRDQYPANTGVPNDIITLEWRSCYFHASRVPGEGLRVGIKLTSLTYTMANNQ